MYLCMVDCLYISSVKVLIASSSSLCCSGFKIDDQVNEGIREVRSDENETNWWVNIYIYIIFELHVPYFLSLSLSLSVGVPLVMKVTIPRTP